MRQAKKPASKTESLKMSKNRKAAEQLALEILEEMAPGGPTVKIYRDVIFKNMDDAQFEQFINDLDSGKQHLCFIAPNFSDNSISVGRNLDIAEKLGHSFFQRILMPANGSDPAYLTPKKYLVIDLPVRRQAQLLDKKISIPENNKSIDILSGQPTGPSKGSKISYPETQVMAAYDLPNCLLEFLKYRGGDLKGFNAMNTVISKHGTVSLNSIAPYAGGVESTRTLKAYLTGMHLGNTL